MRKYVCVLSTDDYLDGCLVLSENLKHVHSQYGLLCLVNENISPETIKILDHFNIEVKLMPHVEYKVDYDEFCQPYWKNTFDKLNVFKLIEYEKIVYLDLDLLITENVDDLFEFDAISMADDSPYTDKHNAGVIVIEPKLKDYYGLITKMKINSSQNNKIGDQAIINEYFKNINTLPKIYNVMRWVSLNLEKDANYINGKEEEVYATNSFINLENVKIVHYIGNIKPFQIKHLYNDLYSHLYMYYLCIVEQKKRERMLNDVAIVVFSCDKNEELWPIFMHCLNKHWENHPNVYLLTETLQSDEMKTINHDYDLSLWTKRIRESLMDIPENKIIFICDDCFIDLDVDVKKLKDCFNILKDNVACVQFELSFEEHDEPCEYPGFKKKTQDSMIRVSLLCGLWQKDKLIEVISEDCDPWAIEAKQDDKGFDYYQVCDHKIISWWHDGPYENGAVRSGKWQHGVEEFLEREEITVDFSKKGFHE